MKSLRTVSGTVTASGNNTIIPASANGRIKVHSLSLITTSTSAVVCTFKNGTSTNVVLFAVPLQALSGSISGMTQSASGGDYLFATSKNTLLNLNLSASQTVYYNIAYWDDEGV